MMERCFGILKDCWHCLRAIHYHPEFAALIVNACCILHNMANKWRVPDNEIYLDELDLAPSMPYENIEDECGEQIRNRIIQINSACHYCQERNNDTAQQMPSMV